MSLQSGERFPEFALQNQDGKTVTLDDFAGKWLVVYVYPKDDTPGCTIQGKSFTATKQEFDDANIAVVGVSEDDVESHKSFLQQVCFHDRSAGRSESRIVEGSRRRPERLQRNDVLEPHLVRD